MEEWLLSGVNTEAVIGLAKEEVFPTLERRYSDGVFSRDLWRKMGSAGFFGFTVSKEYGGNEGSPEDLTIALREFTEHGLDLGVTLSWITHLCLCVKSIEDFGTEEQKEKYIPGLVYGELVGAAAFSEPETRAHPGGMRTTAKRYGEGYRINGKKIYVTGGPVADVLVTLAVTGGGEGNIKELTTFLVETSSPGVKIERMDLNFLRTSPHATIEFEDLEVPDTAVLGKIGKGHSEASRTAFARERALVLSALCGLFQGAVGEISNRFRQKYEGLRLEGPEAGSWIHHLSAIEAYRHLTVELTKKAFSSYIEWKDSLGLLIYLGMSYAKWAYWLEEFASLHSIEVKFPLNVILNDIKLVLVNEGLLFKEGKKMYLS